MLVKQISVFIENKSGRLAEVTKTLGDNGIDIKALSVADTADFGVLRLIVNRPDDAERILRDAGFAVSRTAVIAIGVADVPGGLSVALGILEAGGVAIEYMYAFIGKMKDEALVILRVENPEKAIEVLGGKGIQVLAAETVYGL
jgi:hypothetical protein